MADYENFNTKFQVETAYSDGVRDHRQGFSQQQYFINNQSEPPDDERTGFAPMKSVTQPPKPKGGTRQVSRKKTNKDKSVMDANTKDLKNRNIK